MDDLEIFRKYYDNQYFTDKTLEFIHTNNFSYLESLIDNLEKIRNNITEDYEYLDDKLSFEDPFNFENSKINELKEQIQPLYSNINNLNDWRLFNENCDECSNRYTDGLIDLIREDKVDPELFEVLFDYNFASNCLDEIFSNNPSLNNFNAESQDKLIEEFQQLDKEAINYNKSKVIASLSNKRPSIESVTSSSSPLGVLKHEMGKKTRIKPIRKLLIESRDIIIDIKPCFMMSPMSIAQFLDPEYYESFFDYVIFDDASQLKTEDALGAMLRGKHYVVMGDTKQLPPTSFFEVEQTLDEDDEFLEFKDNESILHLCKNSFNQTMLRWHYRSRHDSLISVSNKEFYNDKLYVFPSPMKNSEDYGLKFEYHLDTVYLRGRVLVILRKPKQLLTMLLSYLKSMDTLKV